MKITNLDQLKSWNRKPTIEIPILMEWFLDWFFGLLTAGNNELAREAKYEFIVFTIICERLSYVDAVKRVNGNLEYYSGYSGKWKELLRIFEGD